MGFDFNPSLWFLCRSCRQPFPNIDKLKEHKLQHHLGDCLLIKSIIFEENCLDSEWVPTSNCFPCQDSSNSCTLPKHIYQDQVQSQKHFHQIKQFQNPYVSLSKLRPQEISSALKTNSRINKSCNSSTVAVHSSKKRKEPVTRSSRTKIPRDAFPPTIQTRESEVCTNEKTIENEALSSFIVPKDELNDELISIQTEKETVSVEPLVLEDGGFIVASIETCPDGTGVVQFEAAEFFEVDSVNTNAEINSFDEIHYEIQSQNQGNYSPKNGEENINDDNWLEDLVSFQANDVDEDQVHTTSTSEFIEESETQAQTYNKSSNNQLDPHPDGENDLQLDLPLTQWLLLQKEKDPLNIILLEPKPELDPTFQDNFLFVSDVNPVKCQLCQESFRSEISLRSHVTSCWNSKKKHRYCHICSQLFSTCNIFRAHNRQIHSSSKPKFKCSSCSEDFANKNLLNFHRKHHHSHLHSESSTQHFSADANAIATSNVFPCKTCNLVFKNPAEVEKHEQSHTSEFRVRVRRRKKYPEEKSERVPKRSFKNIALQLIGERTEEQAEILGASENESNNQSKDSDFEPDLENDDGIASSEESDQELSEPISSSEAINSSDIQSKSRSKAPEDTNPERPFKCPVTNCNRSFANKVQLQAHKYSWHWYLCRASNCNRTFATQVLLARHKETHRKKARGKAKALEKKSLRKKNKKPKIRTVVKPQESPPIQAEFETPEVKPHIVTEDLETTSKCMICKQVFDSVSDLQQHLLTSHSNKFRGIIPRAKMYKCRIANCGEVFNYCSNKIYKHKRIKHREELNLPQFPCPIPNCNRIFNISYYLTQHITRQHRGKTVQGNCEDIVDGEEQNKDLKSKSTSKPKAKEKEQVEEETEERPLLKCTVGTCDRSFTNRDTLSKHKLSRHWEELGTPHHACPEPNCDFVSGLRNSLTRHMRKHSKRDVLVEARKILLPLFKDSFPDPDPDPDPDLIAEIDYELDLPLARWLLLQKERNPSNVILLEPEPVSEPVTDPTLENVPFVTDANPVKCVLCQEFFLSEESLRKHVTSCWSRNKTRHRYCSFCSKLFASPHSFREHKRKSCRQLPAAPKDQRRHMRGCHKKMKEGIDLELEIDLDRPLSQWLLVQKEKNPSNIIQLDPDPTSSDNLDVDVDQSVKCLLCQESFTSQVCLRKHVINCWNFNKKMHRYCLICQRSFSCHVQLRSHIKIWHPAHPAEPRPTFKCSKCPKEFLSISAKNFHEANHDADPSKIAKNFLCPICGKKFRTKNLVDGHINYLHTTEKPWKCTRDGCSAAFKTYTLLNKHTVRYHEPPTFTCSFCGKQLFRENDLTAHERTHTGERPFSCDKCDKAFTSKMRLLVHKRANHRQELGLEEYVCPVEDCDQKFKYVSSIQRHLRRKHQEKSCDD